MKNLIFKISINAPKEKVWNILWEDASYRKWTSEFSEGSHAESDWNEGSKIKFLNANGEGMYAVIAKKNIYKQMTFRHLGDIKNETEKESEWTDAIENYVLNENNGITELSVDLDTTEEYQSYFEETFPKALEVIRKLAEE